MGDGQGVWARVSELIFGLDTSRMIGYTLPMTDALTEPARIERPPGKRKYTQRPGASRPGPKPQAARADRHPDERIYISLPCPEWLRAWGVAQPEGLAEITRQALLREYWRRSAGVGCTLAGDE